MTLRIEFIRRNLARYQTNRTWVSRSPLLRTLLVTDDECFGADSLCRNIRYSWKYVKNEESVRLRPLRDSDLSQSWLILFMGSHRVMSDFERATAVHQ